MSSANSRWMNPWKQKSSVEIYTMHILSVEQNWQSNAEHCTNTHFFPFQICEKILSQGREIKKPEHFSLASLTFAILKSKLVLCLASQEHVIFAKSDLPQATLHLLVKTSICMFLPLVFNELMSLTMERTDICHQDL